MRLDPDQWRSLRYGGENQYRTTAEVVARWRSMAARVRLEGRVAVADWLEACAAAAERVDKAEQRRAKRAKK